MLSMEENLPRESVCSMCEKSELIQILLFLSDINGVEVFSLKMGRRVQNDDLTAELVFVSLSSTKNNTACHVTFIDCFKE